MLGFRSFHTHRAPQQHGPARPRRGRRPPFLLFVTYRIKVSMKPHGGCPRGGRPGLRCPTTSTRAVTEQPMLSTVVDLVGVRLEALPCAPALHAHASPLSPLPRHPTLACSTHGALSVCSCAQEFISFRAGAPPAASRTRSSSSLTLQTSFDDSELGMCRGGAGEAAAEAIGRRVHPQRPDARCVRALPAPCQHASPCLPVCSRRPRRSYTPRLHAHMYARDPTVS